MSYEEVRCGCVWEHLPHCTRLVGVAASIVLWGVGVDMTYHHHTLGLYMLVFSLVVFFLETTWVVTSFIHVCVRSEGGGCVGCWNAVLKFDTWKKTLLYWSAATAVLLYPHTLWLTSLAGGLLVWLGLLHLLLLLRMRLEAREALLEVREDSYDRYEDEQDPTSPEGGTAHTDSDSASTHDYILQV